MGPAPSTCWQVFFLWAKVNSKWAMNCEKELAVTMLSFLVLWMPGRPRILIDRLQTRLVKNLAFRSPVSLCMFSDNYLSNIPMRFLKGKQWIYLCVGWGHVWECACMHLCTCPCRWTCTHVSHGVRGAERRTLNINLYPSPFLAFCCSLLGMISLSPPPWT